MPISTQLTQLIDTRVMSPIIAAQYLADIRLALAKDDYEHAHSLEDALYRHLVEAISLGKCENVDECAKLALETQNLEFCRWCD